MKEDQIIEAQQKQITDLLAIVGQLIDITNKQRDKVEALKLKNLWLRKLINLDPTNIATSDSPSPTDQTPFPTSEQV